MRVTTVRVRPLRRKTVDEMGIDSENITGSGAELWVAGDLAAVVNYDGEACDCEVVWGTPFANEHEDTITALCNNAAPLMLASYEGAGA